MNNENIEELQKVADNIDHLYGCGMIVTNASDGNVMVDYDRGVEGRGLPGGILEILQSEFEKRGLSLNRINIRNEDVLILVFRKIDETAHINKIER